MTEQLIISSAELMLELLIDAELVSDPSADPVKCLPCFLGHLPDDPDDAVMVFNMGGVQQGRSMRTGICVEFPGVQFRIRGKDYQKAYNNAAKIAKYLDEEVCRTEVVIGEQTFLVHSVGRLNSVTDIGIDSSARRRSLFTFSATVSVELLLP